jgi:hypothetical protein
VLDTIPSHLLFSPLVKIMNGTIAPMLTRRGGIGMTSLEALTRSGGRITWTWQGQNAVKTLL